MDLVNPLKTRSSSRLFLHHWIDAYLFKPFPEYRYSSIFSAKDGISSQSVHTRRVVAFALFTERTIDMIYFSFLQFGSPHGLSSQAQYVSAERSEIWVNIGYRLSAFGFLASENPPLRGNYGFKDQWLALEWIKSNIEAFGGTSKRIFL